MEAGGYTHIAAAPRGSVIEQRTETHTFCVVCCIPRPWGSPLIYIQHFAKRSAPIKHALPATTTQSCTKQKRCHRTLSTFSCIQQIEKRSSSFK